jgi:conjugative transfer signal peptidase TraF
VVHKAWRPRVDRRAITWLCGVALILLALIGAAQLLGITINSTPSMPVGVWQVAPVARAVEIGDIVVVCLPEDVADVGLRRGYIEHGACPNGSAPILKFVAARSGDTVTIDARGISVDGMRLPHSRRASRDGHGRALASVAPGTYRIGDGELWLWTPYGGSWDSRYFGAIAMHDVRSFARLLFQGAAPTFDFHATQRLLGRLRAREKAS